MGVRLVAMAGMPGSTHIPVDGPEFIIGRDPSCQLWLDHACVSRRHCRIAAEGGRVFIEDLGSAYGTIVNGRKVPSASLQDGDRLRIGFDEFRLAIEETVGLVDPEGRPAPGGGGEASGFADDSGADFEEAATQDELPIASLMTTLRQAASTSFEGRADQDPAAPASARPDDPPGSPPPTEPAGECTCLIAEGGKAEGKVVKVREPRFLIGRDDGCHLVAKSDLVSRVHAAIDQFDGRVFVRDLGSTNGTVVNDRELQDEEVELADGDRLQVGPLRFRVAIPPGLVTPGPARTAPRSHRPGEPMSPAAGPARTPRPDLGAETEPSAEPETLGELPVANLLRNLQKSATTAFESRSEPPPPPAPAPDAAIRACLIAIDGPSRGQVLELDRPRFLIGRDDICNLLAQSDQVNRIHAILDQRDGKVYLRDLGSTHGTSVNDRGFRDEEMHLVDGDRVRIGPLHFVVSIPAGLVTPGSAPAGPEPRICWASGSAPGASAPIPREAPLPAAVWGPAAGRSPAPTTPAGAPAYATGAPAAPAPPPPPAPTRVGADPDLLPVVDALTQDYLHQALARSGTPEPIPEVPQDHGPKAQTATWKVTAKPLDAKTAGVKKVVTRKDGPIFAVRFFQSWDAIPRVNKVALFLLLVAAPIFAWRGRDLLGLLGRESLATRSSRVVDAAMAEREDQIKPFADPKTLPEMVQWLHLVGPALKRQAGTGVKPVVKVPLQDARAGLATIQLTPAAAGPTMTPTLMLFWSKGPKGDWLLDGHACYLNATSPPDTGGGE